AGLTAPVQQLLVILLRHFIVSSGPNAVDKKSSDVMRSGLSLSWGAKRSSKLETQSRLNLSRAVQHGGNACEVSKPRQAEVAIKNIPVHLAEHMPVESVRNV